MSDKDFDYLFPQAKANPVEIRGYVWKVIVDPTRIADEPGLFYGRLLSNDRYPTQSRREIYLAGRDYF